MVGVESFLEVRPDPLDTAFVYLPAEDVVDVSMSNLRGLRAFGRGWWSVRDSVVCWGGGEGLWEAEAVRPAQPEGSVSVVAVSFLSVFVLVCLVAVV